MLNIEAIAQYLGWIAAIISFGMLLAQPMMKTGAKQNEALTEITKALTEVNKSMALMAKDLENSRDDRKRIHEELLRQDQILDDHTIRIVTLELNDYRHKEELK